MKFEPTVCSLSPPLVFTAMLSSKHQVLSKVNTNNFALCTCSRCDRMITQVRQVICILGFELDGTKSHTTRQDLRAIKQ